MSSIKSLSELQSLEDLSRIIAHSSLSNLFDAPSISAAWGTISLLQGLTGSSQLGLLPIPLSLVARQQSSSEKEPSPESQNFLKDLTHAAHVTSASFACSSVLAGMSSESDEFGDVGLWIGDISLGEAREQHIVRLLGLEHWLQNGGRIVPTDTSSRGIPTGLAKLPHLDRDGAVRGDLDALTSLISRLEQRFEFRLEGAGQGGCVIWFLVGKLALKEEQAWAGLLGAGTWADE